MAKASDLLAELRRRKVVHTAVVYAAFAWAAIEVVTTLLPVFGGRDTVVRILVALILLGLPVAVAVSWMFDFTPGGFKRDEGPSSSATSEPHPASTQATDVILLPPPAPATPLVGRESDVARVVDLLRSATRVVTITGPGGTGKTRVAIAVSSELMASFPGGVAYVEMAAVTDPGAVVPTVAAAVGVKEAETRSLADGLSTVIGDRRMLLVLDNLEQVVEAATDLAALLQRCPGLHLLSTSRAPLRISAEVEFPLPPLELPPPGGAPPLEDLETYSAVELFTDRTRRARPGFRLSADNADAVLGICRRLDGLPLALELAAARLRTLDPGTLLGKLEHALDVLTAGARDLPERQRTLRATIDWSHSLLEDVEQRLFRRLAVFAGGWSHPAIAPVCHGDDSELSLDAFESLVEKGLVRTIDDAGRFGFFETIKEYAEERLAESGEEEAVRERHAEHFLSVVRDMYADFRGLAQVESMERGDAEAANVEVALERTYQAALQGSPGAAERGLRMCGDLWMYWHVRGLHVRAQDWSRRFLEVPSDRSSKEARAWALLTASVASLSLGDSTKCLAEVDEAEALLEGEGQEVGALLAVSAGVAHLTAGALDAAREKLETATRRGRKREQTWELGIAIAFLGIVEFASGDADKARTLFDEALALQKDIGDHEGLGLSLGGHASLEAAAGRHASALSLYQEAFEAYRAIGDRPEEARILDAFAWTALSMGRSDEAREKFVESLRAYEEVGSVRGIGIALLGLAATEAAEDHPRRAIRIAAAASGFSEQEGVAMDYTLDTSAPRYLDEARNALQADEIPRLEGEGRALSVRDAVRYALDRAEDASPLVGRSV